ncbi:MAG: FAD-binding oxidoreductase [Steroidobacter sp.]
MRAATLNGATIHIKSEDVRALRRGFGGVLLQRGDEGYDAARIVFNGMFNRRPALIARCGDSTDVRRIVEFVRRRELLLSVRGGGHSIAGYSSCENGVTIDLSLMRSVSVDPAHRRVRVAGGATWADVDRETQHFGLAAPGGVVSHTGVAGLTLNGGVGWLRNKLGLSCDNLLRVELVTADGEIIEASAERSSDLFWALRGGGGNFGVVTSFEFQLHSLGPEVAAAFPMYPLAQGRDILARWRAWLREAPNEVSSEVVLWTLPTFEMLPAAARGQPVIIPSAVYAGAPEAGNRILDPLGTFDVPLGEISGTMPYVAVQAAFDASFPNTGELCGYWKSLYAPELTEPLLDVLIDLAHHRSSPETMLVVQHMGGAVHEVPSAASAFAERSAPFLINVMGTWRNRDEGGYHIAWVRDAWRRLAAHASSTVYLNYLGEEPAEGDALVRSALGVNYERLVEVKSAYDPGNVFRLNPNIGPAPPP